MLIFARLLAVGGLPMGLSGQQVWRKSLPHQEKYPKEMLEREIHGIDCELQILRTQHQTVVKQIVELERQRYELVCRLNGYEELELPL